MYMGHTHNIALDTAEQADESGFDSFFRTHYDSQVRRAYLMTGSAAQAHDVASEAFGAVYRRWGDLSDPIRYLSRCVLNGCRDQGRRRSRWSKLVVDTAPLAEAVADETADGFSLVDLADALARLSVRQRAAIVLRFYGRESEAAIAEILDCRPGTVGSLIHRGLAGLRKELA